MLHYQKNALLQILYPTCDSLEEQESCIATLYDLSLKKVIQRFLMLKKHLCSTGNLKNFLFFLLAARLVTIRTLFQENYWDNISTSRLHLQLLYSRFKERNFFLQILVDTMPTKRY